MISGQTREGAGPLSSKRDLATLLARLPDVVLARASQVVGVGLILLIAWMGLRLFSESHLTRERFGWGLVFQTDWDTSRNFFGAATFIFGTVASSAVALVIGAPLGVGAALFLTEVAPSWLARPISFIIEMLAAVPSIVFGLWGVAVLCPFLQTSVSPALSAQLGANPIFAGPAVMTNVLAAGLVLTIMILPIICAISREVIVAVPPSLREGSIGLGATRWETIRNIILPAARPGITGACMLGLGRALGETMAVVMVIGNNPQIKASLLQPAYSMAGKLANEFSEAASDPLQRSALIEIALILFAITVLVNMLARVVIVPGMGRAKTSAPRSRFQRLIKFGATAISKGSLLTIAFLLVAIQFGSDAHLYGARFLARPFEIVILLIGLAGLVQATRRKGSVQRSAADLFSRGGFAACGLVACGALGAVLFYVTVHGYQGLNPAFFTQAPKPVGEPGGGMKNAILGTGLLVGIASIVGIPCGLLAGIYAAEFSGNKGLGGFVRFSADVLNGVPSVICGVFAYAAFVLPFGHFSAWAGGLSLAVIMIPTIARTTEDMLKLVPGTLREAAYGLGASKAATVRTVVLPAARAGILTGVMLAVARVAGETAPLLFTAFGSRLVSLNPNQPVESLTMQIYDYSLQPYDELVQQAWTGALVLLIVVMGINLAARAVQARSAGSR